MPPSELPRQTSGEELLRDAVSHGDGFRNSQECEEACRWALSEIDQLRDAGRVVLFASFAGRLTRRDLEPLADLLIRDGEEVPGGA